MHEDEGFVFLFNPGLRGGNATFTVDECIGVSNASAAARWTVTEVYPSPKPYVCRV